MLGCQIITLIMEVFQNFDCTFFFLLALFSLRLYKHVAGTDQVVLGDLVYCKGDNAENVSGGMPECEDDSYNDADDSNHLDEISGMDLPEERNNLVKVWCHNPSIIYYLLLLLLLLVHYYNRC